jgi:hypothetical protein
VCLVLRSVWRDRGGRLTPATLLLLVAVLLPSNVISAQYVVWPVVVCAIALDSTRRTGRERNTLFLACCALGLTTQFVFPLAWVNLLSDGHVGLLAALLHVEALLFWGFAATRFALPRRREPVAASAALVSLPPLVSST